MAFFDDYYWNGTEWKKKPTFHNLFLTALLAQKSSGLGTNSMSTLLTSQNRATWERFPDFLSKLQLTPTQNLNATNNAKNVAETLEKKYYPRNYLIQGASHYLIAGSYLKQTAVRPPSDVDMLYILPVEYYHQYDSYTVNGQSALLQEVKAVLQETYTSTDMSADGQVIKIPFSSFFVELVPCFLATGGGYLIPDTNDGGRWKHSHPIQEKAELDDSNVKTNGNTRNLIKMLKAWKRNCNVEIKSAVLEMRAINFLKTWNYADKGFVYYDWMLRDFFSVLLSKYVNGNCPMPGTTEKIQYGDAWKSKAETAYARAQKACEYESDKLYVSAALEWQKIFGEDFPTT